jgi:hypothetical protein
VEDYNVEKVPVTLHLTPDAARILRQYAGERNRGRFVSDLLVQQRMRDDLESRVVPEYAASRAVVPYKSSQEAPSVPGRRKKSKRGR